MPYTELKTWVFTCDGKYCHHYPQIVVASHFTLPPGWKAKTIPASFDSLGYTEYLCRYCQEQEQKQLNS